MNLSKYQRENLIDYKNYQGTQRLVFSCAVTCSYFLKKNTLKVSSLAQTAIAPFKHIWWPFCVTKATIQVKGIPDFYT